MPSHTPDPDHDLTLPLRQTAKHGRSPNMKRTGSAAAPDEKYIARWSDIWLMRQLQAAYATHPLTSSMLIERSGLERKRFYNIVVYARTNPTLPVLIRLLSALDLRLQVVSWETVATEGVPDRSDQDEEPEVDPLEAPSDRRT